jgi:hypothetical protein
MDEGLTLYQFDAFDKLPFRSGSLGTSALSYDLPVTMNPCFALARARFDTSFAPSLSPERGITHLRLIVARQDMHDSAVHSAPAVESEHDQATLVLKRVRCGDGSRCALSVIESALNA